MLHAAARFCRWQAGAQVSVHFSFCRRRFLSSHTPLFCVCPMFHSMIFSLFSFWSPCFPIVFTGHWTCVWFYEIRTGVRTHGHNCGLLYNLESSWVSVSCPKMELAVLLSIPNWGCGVKSGFPTLACGHPGPGGPLLQEAVPCCGASSSLASTWRHLPVCTTTNVFRCCQFCLPGEAEWPPTENLWVKLR